MRLAAIFLFCAVCLASAQYSDSDGPQRGISPVPIRATRYQRLPVNRPSAPGQIYSNQRLRRPNITFRPRGGSTAEDSLGLGSPFPSSRPIRPNLPTGSALPIAHQVKPVNEEVEEEERVRESSRDDRRSDEEQETEEVEDESEENVARAVANLGAVGSSGGSRTNLPTAPVQQHPQPIQYRPSQSIVPSGRAASSQQQQQQQQQQHPGPAPIQYRPQPKPAKPRKQIQEETLRQTVKATIVKPTKQVHAYDARGKKPVAQIIRRYRNDNPDGSITWGFENDDGSYKEEQIGVDCITRGKYGYVDPDGLRREYTYETGIKCSEQQREEDEENGFVDYQENKLVLPDGKTIDLSSMGKKQTRRPRPSY